jgi:hypothetical protein
MYGFEPPDRIDLRRLALMEACPAAGLGAGSKLPRQPLDRWLAVRDACVSWFNAPSDDEDTADEIADRMFGVFDPVQRELMEEGFAGFLRMGLKTPGAEVDLDPQPNIVVDEASNTLLSAPYQFEISEGGETMAVRLRTGHTGTSDVEAAVFYTTGSPDTTLVDAFVVRDDLAPVERPDPELARSLLASVFARHQVAIAAERPARVPGLHCFRCPRPARCGQYPTIGGDPGPNTRTIVLSKSRIATLDRCHRAAAWPALYGIPTDEGADDEVSPGAVVGSQVHEALGAMLSGEDPEAAIAAACRSVSPSDAADIRQLCERHLDLWRRDPHPVAEVRRAEYQMGVTMLVPGLGVDRSGELRDAPVAVVMIGTTDVNGWESDRVAAVVEHRTGRHSAPLPHEPDLYAVSAGRALANLGHDVEGVAVHVHHLRREPAECERILYGADELAAATERLREVASAAAAWHPTNALGPAFTVGPWCEWCDHRGRCVRFR